MPANPPVAEAVSAAHDIWSAFSAWLQLLEDTLGGLEAGRDLRLAGFQFARLRAITMTARR